ncbi:MAG: cyclomaltodextrinase N-terminal domain-containing protein [Melioribacteraceae bacterium]|nr:cyclomaltodextrinase N-terminal domain-containing protein [Melioribacteraceae bacterium]
MIIKKTIFISTLIITTLFSQDLRVDKIEPPNWWEGMKHNNIQLMVYGEGLDSVKIKSGELNITKIHELENNNYLFVDVDLSEAETGDYEITFTKGTADVTINYPIYERVLSSSIHQGFSNEDVIYLLMPDRFANGDETNDFVEGYVDTFQNQYTQARHGGDIAGVISKLDYLKDLGISTIWLTPIVENNTFRSYHGYSATDLYKVDPRLGTHDTYKTLVNKAHDKGIKIIMDHVANHIAIDHPWIKSLPTADWINGTVQNHLNANHHKMVFADPHSDSATIKHVQEGWFVDYMPDLNHKNKFLANYIIQNTLWWIESTGVDGIREDTYPYCDQLFMAKWAEVIMNEYPTFNIVGEVWTGNPAFLSTYQAGNKFREVDSNLPAITDFGLRDALADYLRGNKSLYNIYTTLASDFLYADVNQLVTFVDNHDVGRAMFYADSDVEKLKIAFHLLFTTRGIPQIFYGTEIGMKENEDHGTLRKNFPGGFPNDARNAFSPDGRTEYENDIFNYFKKMLMLRKEYPALSMGKLIHFPPYNDVYVYFKILDNEIILNVINAGDNDVEIDVREYSEIINGRVELINLYNLQKYNLNVNSTLIISNNKAVMFLIK